MWNDEERSGGVVLDGARSWVCIGAVLNLLIISGVLISTPGATDTMVLIGTLLLILMVTVPGGYIVARSLGLRDFLLPPWLASPHVPLPDWMPAKDSFVALRRQWETPRAAQLFFWRFAMLAFGAGLLALPGGLALARISAPTLPFSALGLQLAGLSVMLLVLGGMAAGASHAARIRAHRPPRIRAAGYTDLSDAPDPR